MVDARRCPRWLGGLLAILFAAGPAGCGVGPHCVAEGTLVLTPSGARRIETLRTGDAVVSIDASGARTVSRVSRVSAHPPAAVLEIDLAGPSGPLRVTAAHPVAVEPGAAFRDAGAVRPGDVLVTEDGPARVSAVSPAVRAARVYDLTVTPDGTFFAAGVLVHNKTMIIPPEPRHLVGEWIGFSDGATRLELRGDRTALLAMMRADESIHIYRASHWELHGFAFDIEFEPVNPTDDVVYLIGQGTYDRLSGYLSVAPPTTPARYRSTIQATSDNPWSIVFWRESVVLEQAAALRARMRAIRESAATPTTQPE